MDLIDTHAHLDDKRFHTDLEAVLSRAQTAGVQWILTIGVDRETSEAAVALSHQYPHILRAVVGIQPNYVHEMDQTDWPAIVSLANDPLVVGIGETGLDDYWKKSPLEFQQIHFQNHLELARQRDLPMIIHCREAEEQTANFLEDQANRHGPIRGIMHSFCGQADVARRCLAAGLHISFAGMVTFPKNQELRDVAAGVPADRLLVETDSPYLAPVPHRSRRNEPAYVVHTLSVLAECRGVLAHELARQTTGNARTLFRLPEPGGN